MRPLILGASLGRGTRGAGIAAGCAIVLLALLVLVLQGVARTSSWMLPVLTRTATVMLVILPVLLALAVPRRTRLPAALALSTYALLLGVIVWLYALLFTLQTWGWIAVIIGVALFGVGLIPIAILAAAVTSTWTVLLYIVTALVVASVSRIAARAARASLTPPVSPQEIQVEYRIND